MIRGAPGVATPTLPPSPTPHSWLQRGVVAGSGTAVLPPLAPPLPPVLMCLEDLRDGLVRVSRGRGGRRGGGRGEAVAMTTGKHPRGDQGGVREVRTGGVSLHDRDCPGAGQHGGRVRPLLLTSQNDGGFHHSVGGAVLSAIVRL